MKNCLSYVICVLCGLDVQVLLSNYSHGGHIALTNNLGHAVHFKRKQDAYHICDLLEMHRKNKTLLFGQDSLSPVFYDQQVTMFPQKVKTKGSNRKRTFSCFVKDEEAQAQQFAHLL